MSSSPTPAIGPGFTTFGQALNEPEPENEEVYQVACSSMKIEREDTPLREKFDSSPSGKSERSFDSSVRSTITSMVGSPGGIIYWILVGFTAFIAFAVFVVLIGCLSVGWHDKVERASKLRFINTSVTPTTSASDYACAFMAIALAAQAICSCLGLGLFFASNARSVKLSKLQKLSGGYFCILTPINVLTSWAFSFLPTAPAQTGSGAANTIGNIMLMFVLFRRCQAATEGIDHAQRGIFLMKCCLKVLGFLLVGVITVCVVVDILDKAGVAEERDGEGNKKKLFWDDHGQLFLGGFVFTPYFIIATAFWTMAANIFYQALKILTPSAATLKVLNANDCEVLQSSFVSARYEFIAIALAWCSFITGFPFMFVAFLDATAARPEEFIMAETQLAIATCFVAADSVFNDVAAMTMCSLGWSSERARDACLSAMRVALKSQTLANARVEMEETKKTGNMTPWVEGFEFNFINVDMILRHGGPLPKHQEMIKTPGWMTQKTVNITEIWDGSLMAEAAAVSYAWNTKEHPDPDGSQTDAVRQFLMQNPRIKWLWMDWASLPQNERTPEEKTNFVAGLKNVNMMYLGCTVIIILTPDYLERFWTQLEAFLSFQSMDATGLSPAGSPFPRTHCVFTSSVPESQQNAIRDELVKKWSECGVLMALSQLAEPDTKVTSGADKITQIGKLMELQITAQDSFKAVISGEDPDSVKAVISGEDPEML